jgi:hypothetical protein
MLTANESDNNECRSHSPPQSSGVIFQAHRSKKTVSVRSVTVGRGHDQFRCLSKTFEVVPIALQLLERGEILLICLAPAQQTLNVAFSAV